MSGLPAIPTSRRPRPIWERVILESIERMTHHLMSGAEIPEADLNDMAALRQRLLGFDRALEARLRAAGQVIEDEK